MQSIAEDFPDSFPSLGREYYPNSVCQGSIGLSIANTPKHQHNTSHTNTDHYTCNTHIVHIILRGGIFMTLQLLC